MIDLKKLVMINAFVRDMTEGVKGYDTSEEFPQTLWHFVILFQDWALSPRNAWVYGVTKSKHLIYIDKQTGLPRHTHSKHIICVTIFSCKHLGKWGRKDILGIWRRVWKGLIHFLTYLWKITSPELQLQVSTWLTPFSRSPFAQPGQPPGCACGGSWVLLALSRGAFASSPFRGEPYWKSCSYFILLLFALNSLLHRLRWLGGKYRHLPFPLPFTDPQNVCF